MSRRKPAAAHIWVIERRNREGEWEPCTADPDRKTAGAFLRELRAEDGRRKRRWRLKLYRRVEPDLPPPRRAPGTIGSRGRVELSGTYRDAAGREVRLRAGSVAPSTRNPPWRLYDTPITRRQ